MWHVALATEGERSVEGRLLPRSASSPISVSSGAHCTVGTAGGLDKACWSGPVGWWGLTACNTSLPFKTRLSGYFCLQPWILTDTAVPCFCVIMIVAVFPFLNVFPFKNCDQCLINIC